MKVYFLGTGTSQGIPVIGSNHPVCKSTDFKDKRLRVSVWVSWENYSFVIDCGPDFRQQMLSSNCQKVEGILFTHEHSDHTVIDNIKRRFEYVFETVNKYPGAPSVETIEVINNQPFPLGNKMVIPIDVMHGNLQVFGYRIDDFAYLTDVKTIEKSEIEKLKNVKVLVINALREEPHDMHFNLKEALDFITLVQPKTTYLTHISHIMGFHEEVQKRLPENVFLAYDNLEITI